jgi:hypothetical protein
MLLVSWPVRAVAGTDCDSMVLSAQIANAIAGVLLVFPMFALGRLLFNRRTAFFAVALFQALPVAARVTSDGLSDGLFLLVTTTTLWLAVRALRHPSAGGFALCGIGVGFGYLVRPEGVLAAGAVGIVVALLLLARRWQPRTAMAAYAGLAAGMLLTGIPYVALTGHLSNKPTAHRVEQKLRQLLGIDPVDVGPTARHSGVMLLAEWYLDPNGGSRDPDWTWVLQALGSETFKSFHYAPAALALAGLWFYRRRLTIDPAGSLLLVMIGMQAVALWAAAMTGDQAYVSERHTLVIVLAGSFWAAAAIPIVARWVAARTGMAGRGWAVATLLVLVASAVPVAAKPLHANRAGHHAAGLWLAAHVGPDDFILDPFEWAQFYASRTGTPVKPHPDGWKPHVHYVVLEPGDKQRSCLPKRIWANEVAASGTMVFHWPANVAPEQAKVQVFRTLAP